MKPAPEELGPQYWKTHCLVCEKLQYAATAHVICGECEETDAVVTFILDLQKKVVALEGAGS
jgi:hypothetical protein